MLNEKIMKKEEIINKLHKIYDLVNIETCWIEIIQNYIDNKEYCDFNLMLILDKLQKENTKLYNFVENILTIE